MCYHRLLIIAALGLAIFAGCAKKADEVEIKSLLEESWYVADGSVQTADDSTSTPREAFGPGYFADTIDFVRWVRHIERPVVWSIDVTVDGDSADAVITGYFLGTPPGYGIFVCNDSTLAAPIYNRAITDSVARKVKLYRDDSGWHILSLTVADMYTVGTGHPVTITQVRAYVASRNYTFTVTSADQYFAKSELPIFYPSDTVEVTVTCQAQDDSTWAFLHHGAGHKPGVGLHRHWRQPFFRETTTTFKRVWVIADDSVLTTPAVRHSAVDVLGWQTLFGDSTATYYSRAWGIPYVVKLAQDELPADEAD
jgi:hypothetical protein